MSHDPPILIVDEDDRPIGSATKTDAQKQGLIHRIVNVIVEDPAGRLLLQRRSNDSELWPGAWDAAVGGHVDEGEDYIVAAKREMFEEIGLKDVELKELGTKRRDRDLDWRRLRRFYKLYRAVVPVDTVFKPEESEVAELKWFSVDEVKAMIKADEKQFTFNFVDYIERYY